MQNILRASNEVWHAMYYDELLNTNKFQISYLQNSDRSYFNCAHCLRDINLQDLDFIEQYFIARQLKPAIYLDKEIDKDLENILVKRGYQEIADELEHCYTVTLTKEYLATVSQDLSNLIPPLKLDCVNFSPITNNNFLKKFLALDQLANSINDNSLAKLAKNLVTAKNNQIQFFCIVALKDNSQITSSVLLALYQNNCFLAEGATHPHFRQQGIFSWLLLHGIKFASSMHCNTAIVNCDRYAYSNQAFKKIGFNLTDSRRFLQKISLATE